MSTGINEAYGKNLDSVQAEIAEACEATSHVHFFNEDELLLMAFVFLAPQCGLTFVYLGTTPGKRQCGKQRRS
jgi:uncharacterized protein YbbK (DUF523 family)